MILVTGATGFVGRHVVVALRDAGHRVRCATRSLERARASSPELEWVELDLLRPSTLEPALAGCDSAVFLVHGMESGHGTDYPEREQRGAHAFAEAAAAARLTRIVYLGGVVPTTGASRHLRSRQRTGETLRAGSVETLELRAAMVIGAESTSWVMVRDLARRLPAMVLPRWLRNTSYPIGIDDVVHGIVAALALPTTGSAIFELPGPERLTHREVLIRAATAMGRRRRLMISVPILTPRLSSYWIALVTRTSLVMARELVEGVRSNLEPTNESLWDRIGHRPLSIDEAIRRALVDERTKPPRASDPRGHVLRCVIALVVATLAFSTALALRHHVDPWRSTAIAALASSAIALWALGAHARALVRTTVWNAAGAIALGGLLVAATHGTYRLASSLSPPLAAHVRDLYASIDVGAPPLALALLTTIVVLGEELIWRGVAFEILGPATPKLALCAISVGLYVAPQLVGGEAVLVIAAALLGSIFAAQRVVTGRLVDPFLTHLVWSVSVFVVVPLV
ncbi:MAG: NAD(P)H-binding protein [Kofleriaceae bacterium]